MVLNRPTRKSLDQCRVRARRPVPDLLGGRRDREPPFVRAPAVCSSGPRARPGASLPPGRRMSILPWRQQARGAVEGSDCLLSIGHRRVDSTSGFLSDALPADVISIRPFSADVGTENFQALTLGELPPALAAMAPARSGRLGGAWPARTAQADPDATAASSGPFTQAATGGRPAVPASWRRAHRRGRHVGRGRDRARAPGQL